MKRPTFLTIWLVLMSISAVYALYTYTLGVEMLKKAWGNAMPEWAFGLLALLGVANLVGVVLLWTWKKIGFYTILGQALFTAAVNGMLLGVAGMVSTIFAAIGVLILYLAMKPVWQSFK